MLGDALWFGSSREGNGEIYEARRDGRKPDTRAKSKQLKLFDD